jgi:hypothetical protein
LAAAVSGAGTTTSLVMGAEASNASLHNSKARAAYSPALGT